MPQDENLFNNQLCWGRASYLQIQLDSFLKQIKQTR